MTFSLVSSAANRCGDFAEAIVVAARSDRRETQAKGGGSFGARRQSKERRRSALPTEIFRRWPRKKRMQDMVGDEVILLLETGV